MAQLHIGLLARQRTKNGIRSALEQLPDELPNLYDTIMDRISGPAKEDAELAQKVLQWITYAKEPLQATAIQHAVAVTPESTDLAEDDLVPIDDLVSICIGIVTVDRESGVMRLVHYTIQKYLELQWPKAHLDIARICLTYLSFDPLKEPCEDKKSLYRRVSQYALIRHAAKY